MGKADDKPWLGHQLKATSALKRHRDQHGREQGPANSDEILEAQRSIELACEADPECK